jgi:uncharacterized RDD family membrane protein YckC
MDQISILTSQNISIEQTVASVAERIVAAIIDFAFMSVYLLFVWFYNIAADTPTVFIFLSLPVLLYQLLSEIFMHGQSWGKKIMKIKVVKIDGTEPDFLSCLIRWIFRIVDVTFLFGGVATITIIVNGKGQRLGDIAAHTAVIRLKENQMGQTIYEKIPPGYSIVFTQINKLTDKDIYTAKEVVDYIEESYASYESMKMAQKAKSALENKMGITSDLRPEAFLKTVIKDYNCYYSA